MKNQVFGHRVRVKAFTIALFFFLPFGLAVCKELQPPHCNAKCSTFDIDEMGSSALRAVVLPPNGTCTLRTSNGYPIPDPQCTPGAINPTLTQSILRDPDFRTCCIRNQTTTEDEKNKTYQWYWIAHPMNNVGKNQICELDHLISLELGGADTLDNLWPQCGPEGAPLERRYFKEKDTVENYLAAQVKQGKISLEDAQRGISTNWTQYIDQAKAAQ